VINHLTLLRNVGQFASVEARQFDLLRLVLIYAENGRGKTTLSAIFRSLATGEAVPIVERRRLGAQHAPHVVIDCTGGPPPAVFENGAWSRRVADMAIFDDVFVDQNVCSGLDVDASHRQRLHEVILGAQGIVLARELQNLADRIVEHNAAIREKGSAIPVTARGTLTVDEFCALPNLADIDDQILAAQRRVTALSEANAIATTSEFSQLNLPEFNLVAIGDVLSRTLESLGTEATAAVQAHIATLGAGGEAWLANGMSRGGAVAETSERSPCPFCGQSLAQSELISLYRQYFGAEYSRLKQEITTILEGVESAHGANAALQFERSVHAVNELRRFWASVCQLPEMHVDTAPITAARNQAMDMLLTLLRAKQAAPLELLTIDDLTQERLREYEGQWQLVTTVNASIRTANEAVRLVKARIVGGNLNAARSELARLQACKARHSLEVSPVCQAYLDEKRLKTETESAKVAARESLDSYRARVFPAFEAAINSYLRRFNAGFEIARVTAANPQGQPSCSYQLRINGAAVPVGVGNPAEGSPSFKNTLSGGDRTTLALAFFLASLELDPRLPNLVVVIDDPISSLDDHRSLTTVQEIRALSRHASQVIVLAHEKSFLCKIWEHADRQNCTPLHIARDAEGSTIAAWDVSDECITDYDRHHEQLREYRKANIGDRRQIARVLRPLLEGFLRRACPAHFKPGENLGVFRRRIQNQLAGATSILGPNHVAELDALAEYANKFHHDTNPAYVENEDISDGELCGFIDRTMDFVRK
jgi:wobble nucleotide-excising tRNase